MPTPDLTMPPAELEAYVLRRLAARTPVSIHGPGARRAAVLLPLFFRHGVPYLLFTQRSEEVPTHKGQVSFPGGVVELSDGDPVTAALRETAEEVGIPPQQVRLLGRLDDVLTSASNFAISPFVGVVPAGAAHITSDQEVARLFDVPLAFLLEPGNRAPDERTQHWRYHWPEAEIWGATARILSSFLGILGLADPPTEAPCWCAL